MSDLEVGFSTCPNDTFMFHAMVHGLCEMPAAASLGAPDFKWVMEDIERLNQRALRKEGALAMTKLSVGALAEVCDRYAVINAGAALGHGCGPLLLSRKEAGMTTVEDLSGKRIAIPGFKTSAFLYLQLLIPPGFEVVSMEFSEIMPALLRGEVDAGLVIHESRFTYEKFGLHKLLDLGEAWERETNLPMPLGLICVRRDLGVPRMQQLEQLLQRSVDFAWESPEHSRAWIAQHAQEMAEDVCQRHIELYVNAYSRDIGKQGRLAVDEVLRRGRSAGILAETGNPWFFG